MALTRRALGICALTLGLAAAIAGGPALPAAAQDDDTLTIAYNVSLPSWDPTVGPSAVNPTIQGIYRSVFDQFIGQAPDLTIEPGILTEWGWTDDNTRIRMVVRDGVKWHNGDPLTRRRRGLVAGARRHRRDRQPDPVRLVEGRQLSRSTATSSPPT